MATNTALIKSLKLFEEVLKIDSGFPVNYVVCLHYIAMEPGLSLTELGERTGLQMPTVSRIVGALSKWRQNGQPYGLVEMHNSETERRRKELFLTDRGQFFITRVEHIMTQK